jgi:hypothetical protein
LPACTCLLVFSTPGDSAQARAAVPRVSPQHASATGAPAQASSPVAVPRVPSSTHHRKRSSMGSMGAELDAMLAIAGSHNDPQYGHPHGHGATDSETSACVASVCASVVLLLSRCPAWLVCLRRPVQYLRRFPLQYSRLVAFLPQVPPLIAVRRNGRVRLSGLFCRCVPGVVRIRMLALAVQKTTPAVATAGIRVCTSRVCVTVLPTHCFVSWLTYRPSRSPSESPTHHRRNSSYGSVDSMDSVEVMARMQAS